MSRTSMMMIKTLLRLMFLMETSKITKNIF